MIVADPRIAIRSPTRTHADAVWQEQRRAPRARLRRLAPMPTATGKPTAAGTHDRQEQHGPPCHRTEPRPDGRQREHPAQGDQVAADAGDDGRRRVRKVCDDDAEPDHAQPDGDSPPVGGHVVAWEAEEHQERRQGEQDRDFPRRLPPEHESHEPCRPHRTGDQGEKPGDPVRPRRGLGLTLRIYVCVERAANDVDKVGGRGGPFLEEGAELFLVAIAPRPGIESDEPAHDGEPPRATSCAAAPCSVRRYACRPLPFVVGSMRSRRSSRATAP